MKILKLQMACSLLVAGMFLFFRESYAAPANHSSSPQAQSISIQWHRLLAGSYISNLDMAQNLDIACGVVTWRLKGESINYLATLNDHGTLLWKKPYLGILLNTKIFSARNKILILIAPSDQEWGLRWNGFRLSDGSATLPFRLYASDNISSDGKLFLNFDDFRPGNLVALVRENGHRIWSKRFNAGPMSPARAPGAYALSPNGKSVITPLGALNAQGQFLWKWPKDSPIDFLEEWGIFTFSPDSALFVVGDSSHGIFVVGNHGHINAELSINDPIAIRLSNQGVVFCLSDYSRGTYFNIYNPDGSVALEQILSLYGTQTMSDTYKISALWMAPDGNTAAIVFPIGTMVAVRVFSSAGKLLAERYLEVGRKVTSTNIVGTPDAKHLILSANNHLWLLKLNLQ